MTAMEAQAQPDAGNNGQKLSALHANISEKKENSYYYAHKKKDCGEEPAPMPVHVVLQKTKADPLDLPKPISHYQFLDDDDLVKVYVPLEGIGELADDCITCTFEQTAFDLRVKGYGGKNLKLSVKQLFGDIDPATSTHRKLKDKLIVKMQKVKDEDGKTKHWSALRSTA